MPNSFNAPAAASVGIYKSDIARFKAVAALPPVTFCSANLNNDNVTLSADCPKLAPVAAEPDNASPSPLTSVAASVAPFAIKSA